MIIGILKCSPGSIAIFVSSLPGEALSPGQLSAAHFMGSTLARQLQDTRARMSEAQEQRVALEQDLTRQAHRQQVLTERADETRRALVRDREDES